MQKQDLDIYAPKAEGSYPVHIYVHGGAWMIGDKRIGRRHGHFFAPKDIILVSVNYRLAPDDPHPAQMNVLAAAVKWVVKNIGKYGGDTDRITISGHSAGAHMVALLGTDPSYLKRRGLSLDVLKAVMPVDTAGYDLTTPHEGRGKRIMKKAVAETFGNDPAVLKKVSPIKQLEVHKNRYGQSLPKFRIFISGEAKTTQEDSRAFHTTLSDIGGDSELFIIDGATHREMNLLISEEESVISKVFLKTISEN